MWRPLLLRSKEVTALVEKLCVTERVADVLFATIIDAYPPSGAEAFVSFLLSIVTKRIFDLARAGGASSTTVTRTCALLLKEHCDQLVKKTSEVRFWCVAAAFHTTEELRVQTIPAAISLFDVPETVADGETGLRNAILNTRSFMTATTTTTATDAAPAVLPAPSTNKNNNNAAVARGMSPDELLELLIVLSSQDASFSTKSQLRAIATLVKMTQRVPLASTSLSSSAAAAAAESGIPAAAATTTGLTTLVPVIKIEEAQRVLERLRLRQPPPSLLMRAINLFLAREANEPFRRFASIVARHLVTSEVWTHDAEQWRGVQAYLEQEVVANSNSGGASAGANAAGGGGGINNNSGSGGIVGASAAGGGGLLVPGGGAAAQSDTTAVIQSLPRRILQEVCQAPRPARVRQAAARTSRHLGVKERKGGKVRR